MVQDSLSIIFSERPTGDIVPGKTFTQERKPAPTEADLKDGEILVRNMYLSIDPAMRGWMNDRRSYAPPLKIGAVMRGGTIARVLASKSSQAQPGDNIVTYSGWQEFAILSEGQFTPASALPKTDHLPDYLSILGLTGLTAHHGMLNIGEPKAGELVVVSGAAGAVGSIAGQLAKLKGAKVIGIVGSEDKAKWIKEDLGFDVALNYKDTDYADKFKEATKDLIDVYFDNVGGETLELALGQAKPFARFVACGSISNYNNPNPRGPKNYFNVVTMRIKLQGFIVTDHAPEFPKMREELAGWLNEGKLKRKETIIKKELEEAENVLASIYKGANTGKLLMEIKNPQEVPKL